MENEEPKTHTLGFEIDPVSGELAFIIACPHHAGEDWSRWPAEKAVSLLEGMLATIRQVQANNAAARH